MERYDYHEAVYNDVVDYIRENINFADYDTICWEKRSKNSVVNRLISPKTARRHAM